MECWRKIGPIGCVELLKVRVTRILMSTFFLVKKKSRIEKFKKKMKTQGRLESKK